MRRATSAGMTLASVVISAGTCRLLERLEVGVVVDVAVERADDVGAVGAVELLVVQRVRVGLGDDADARPAGVTEHHDLGGVVGQREVQQRVVADRGAQHRGVVAELPDLGRGLVDERELVAGGAHRARSEQRVGRPHLDETPDGRLVEVEPVVAHEEVQPGRVAAAHLEAVDGRERDLHREERLDARRSTGRHRRATPPRARCGGGRGRRPRPRRAPAPSAALTFSSDAGDRGWRRGRRRARLRARRAAR